LTPTPYGAGDARWDTWRNCEFNEILGFYGLAYWYTWQVSILGLGPIWMSPNEALRQKAAQLLREGEVFAFGLSEREQKSHNPGHQADKTGFLGFYLDMDYSHVKNIMDSLLDISELYYIESIDILGNKQKNLFHGFSEINPTFSAKVNLKGSQIIDGRLTSIQLTLCNRKDSGDEMISYNCDINDITRLFESYSGIYGRPTLLDQGIKYDWLSKRIPNVYFPGPKGRWMMDKIYFWEKGNYIIYFDFGYPGSPDSAGDPEAVSGVYEPPDSTSAPIIYYDFSQDYIDVLLDKASRMKEGEFKIQRPDSMR
jgi:hypothetical protein